MKKAKTPPVMAQEFKTPNPDEAGMENQMSDSEMQGINIQEYVYPPDTMIPIPVNLWNLINQLATLTVNQEIPVKYNIPQDLNPEDQAKPLMQLADEGKVQPVRMFATNLGIMSDAVLTFMSEAHVHNIHTGVAIHQDDMQKRAEAKSGLDMGSTPAPTTDQVPSKLKLTKTKAK